MFMKSFSPLLTGIILPISTFFNIQAFTVPGWLSQAEPEDDGEEKYIKHRVLTTLAAISICFGIFAVVALFLRMLEKKIKWTSRSIIVGSLGQAVFSLMLVAILSFTVFSNAVLSPTEAFIYSSLCCMLSFFVGIVYAIHLHSNRSHVYTFILYELTVAQRQLILLTIATLTYLVIGALVYSHLEPWDFNAALYWGVVTLGTIGFGDLYPKSIYGKITLPFFASFGILLIGGFIFAIRNVVLELITFSLGNTLSKSFEDGHFPGKFIDQSDEDDTGQSGPHYRHFRALSNHGVSPSLAPHLIPEKSDAFSSHHHHPIEALDLCQSSSSSQHNHLSQSPPSLLDKSKKHILNKHIHIEDSNPHIFSIKRGENLPELTFHAPHADHQDFVLEVTRETFKKQIFYAVCAVVANIILFGGIFAAIEGWYFFDGLYFSYCSLLTIGFGDFSLKTVLGRSLFIWHVFIGIASITYLTSMVAERIMNQWTLQVGKIERRVDRYETKAKLKKRFGKPKTATNPNLSVPDASMSSSSSMVTTPETLPIEATQPPVFALPQSYVPTGVNKNVRWSSFDEIRVFDDNAGSYLERFLNTHSLRRSETLIRQELSDDEQSLLPAGRR